MSELEQNPERTPACRCYGCGSEEPMACGTLCADCSYEEHLASMAHTIGPGENMFDPPGEVTPHCCRVSYAQARERFARWLRELEPDGTYGGARKVPLPPEA